MISTQRMSPSEFDSLMRTSEETGSGDAALARKSSHCGCRVTTISKTVRTLVTLFGQSVSKLRKSCFPTSSCAASCIAAAFSARRIDQVYRLKNGSGTGQLSMRYRYRLRVALNVE